MSKQLTKAEEYVLARLNANALYNSLTVEEKREADMGMHWANLAHDQNAAGEPKRRGRKVGSKNRKADGQAVGAAQPGA